MSISRKNHRASPPRSLSRRHRWIAPGAALLAALAGGVVFGASSCDGGGETATDDPCETVYEGQCGAACVYDMDCPDGLYCSADGKCDADCVEGGRSCPAGQTCTPRGRCDDGGQGGAGGGIFTGTGGGPGSGGGDVCPDVEVTFEKQIPTVLLLIDQSGSMTADFAGAGSRWEVLYQTLMDPATGVVATLEDEVRFGLALYTGTNAMCPALTEVPIAIGNHAAIDAVYAPSQPLSETPTGDSIDAVLPALVAFPEAGPKIIVLATDGEPDTCEVPNPQQGQGEAIAAAQNAFAQDVETYVISVGSDVSQAHLQDMANAGVGLPVGGAMNAPFYVALDQQTLIDAFNDIINGVRSCVIELNGTVAAEDAALGHVTLDGQELPYNDPNGWTFTPPNQVELQGAACEAIQTGDHMLSVVFPCDTVQPE